MSSEGNIQAETSKRKRRFGERTGVWKYGAFRSDDVQRCPFDPGAVEYIERFMCVDPLRSRLVEWAKSMPLVLLPMLLTPR